MDDFAHEVKVLLLRASYLIARVSPREIYAVWIARVRNAVKDGALPHPFVSRLTVRARAAPIVPVGDTKAPVADVVLVRRHLCGGDGT